MQRIQPVAQELSPDSMGESAGGFGFRLIVSPIAGRLRHLPPARFVQGEEWVVAGQPVAMVEQGTTTFEVRSPIDGRVGGVLVRDGEPVQPGQPLVWLMPGASPPSSGGR